MSEQKHPLRTIEVETGVSPDFLQAVLTKDITTLEALYDLIDNSIDAARNSLLLSGTEKIDQRGLPTNYSSFHIEITIGRNLIAIRDNCLGIDESTLQSKAFQTGNASSHPFGIGHFGIGLKRSLLKIGADFQMSTDDGNHLYEAKFDKSQIGGALNNKMSANVFPTTGEISASFSVTGLHSEIKNDINSAIWFENAVLGLSRRYSIYTEKGLAISLTSVDSGETYLIEGHVPGLREDGKFLPVEKVLNIGGVKIEIRSGIHEGYYFPNFEDQHSISKSRKLTNEFGMYFICNDRVIVSASTEHEHGWKAKWHSEYNGYVCLIHFLSEDPSLLPLNTSKTGLRIDSPLFLELKGTLQPIANHYRSEIKKRYPAKDNSKPKPTTSKPLGGENNGENQNGEMGLPVARPMTPPKEKPKDNRDRDELIFWNTCLTRVPETRVKEYSIFVELGNLSSLKTPLSSILLIRAFLEITVKRTAEAMSIDWMDLTKTTRAVADKLILDTYISKPTHLKIRRYTEPEKGTNEYSFMRISNIQSIIHSSDFNASKSMANNYWDDLDPFLAVCWDFLQKISKD